MTEIKDIRIDIRNILAELYDDSRRIRVIADDSGLVAAELDLTGPVRVVWHHLLLEAEKRRLVNVLLEIVVKDFPNRDDLRNAWTEYVRLVAPDLLATSVTRQPTTATNGFSSNIRSEVVITTQILLPQIPTAIVNLLDPDAHPLVEWTIRSKIKQKLSLVVHAFIEGFSATATNSIELLDSEQQVLRQLPTFFPQSLRDLHEPVKGMLNLKVERTNHEIEFHETKPIWMHPRNSFPLTMKVPQTGEWLDLTRYLGAFVTPTVSTIFSFLRMVAKRHPQQILLGYGGDVQSQVRAIFDALKNDSEIIFVSTKVNINTESLRNQRVRLPRESLQERQANSLDAALLFASLLEAISINPAIIVIPGEVFVGWETGANTDQWDFLDTLMIPTHNFEEALQISGRKVLLYQTQADKTQNPGWYRHWSLKILRTQFDILPLE